MARKQEKIKTLLLFDIDGTLVRAEDATRKAMLRAFHDIFRTEQTFENVSFVGRTDPELFQETSLIVLGHRLGEREYAALTERYLSLLPQELTNCAFRLMPGVAQLLEKLTAIENILLGLETGNLETSAYQKLKRGNIDHYFSLGGFGSDSENRTELVRIAIERARSVYDDCIPDNRIFIIGDSPHDIIAGRNVGANTLAVGTGLVPKEKLLAESPSYYLSDFNDIHEFMKCVG